MELEEGAVFCWAGKIIRTAKENWNVSRLSNILRSFGYWVLVLITNRLMWRMITRVLFVFRAVLFRLRRTRQCCLLEDKAFAEDPRIRQSYWAFFCEHWA